ncbi:MAG TPA: helix-turn-helix domain-containing protein [Pseudolysinimonas sp.]|nr:helix-turn-helix domain-containing protein [Pseudolysinimonas sp.]
MNEAELGAFVTARRKRLKLNQAELARLADISRSALSALENGAGPRGATITTLLAVISVLGLCIELVEARRP